MSILSVLALGIAIAAWARASHPELFEVAAAKYALLRSCAATSKIINGLTGGGFAVTLCARVGEAVLLDRPGQPFWRRAEAVLDRAFRFYEPDHCLRSYARALLQ